MHFGHSVLIGADWLICKDGFDERYRIPQDDSSDQDDSFESPSDGERDSERV